VTTIALSILLHLFILILRTDDKKESTGAFEGLWGVAYINLVLSTLNLILNSLTINVCICVCLCVIVLHVSH
jgi:hypothetical protein